MSPSFDAQPSPLVPSDSALASILARILVEPSAPEVVAVYLFGSVAEGRAHRESDVDLAVLLDWASHATAASRFDAGIRLAGAVQGQLGRRVDLVVLNDAPPLLGRHAVTRGRRILCRDPRADHEYVRDVQLRAADLEPWLRRMRARKLAAIRGSVTE
jgi:predicted nucleotidyltransferase